MAKIPYSINEPITGTVGSVVGTSWKGEPHIKANGDYQLLNLLRQTGIRWVSYYETNNWQLNSYFKKHIRPIEL